MLAAGFGSALAVALGSYGWRLLGEIDRLDARLATRAVMARSPALRVWRDSAAG